MGDEMDSLTFFPRASASHGAGMCLLHRFLSRFPFASCMHVSVFQVLSTLAIGREPLAVVAAQSGHVPSTTSQVV